MKKDYVIICDSSMDLEKDVREEFKIEDPVLGSVVSPDGVVSKVDLDWEKTSFEEYFNGLEKKKLNFKTSLPNQYEIVSHCEKYIKEDKDILLITISSTLSGTHNQFLSSVNELKEKYPKSKIYLIDSLRYSSGVGLLAIYASINRSNGMTIDENYQWIEQNKLCAHQIGILDDLFFLYRNGRISYKKAFMGNMIGIKPMADFDNETGSCSVLGNARGYKKSIKLLVKYIEHYIGNLKDKIIVFAQSNREKVAKEMIEAVRAAFPNLRILLSRVGQFSGTNVGPGLCAAFFMGDKPISKGCVEEKQFFTTLLGE